MLLKNKFLIFLILLGSYIYGIYPEVTIINSDILYKQLKSEILENNKRLSQNKDYLPIQFFTYTLGKDDTIFSVASRFNIPYDTISSLNGIENQLFFSSFKSIIIPTCAGIFSESKKNEAAQKVTFNDKLIYFTPGERFSSKERLKFLVTPFRSPLSDMRVSSPFGNRQNPFTGKDEFHGGLDLKSTLRNRVFSPYRGVISSVGYSDFYGNYLIIQHPYGYTSHFFHLDNVFVKKGVKVDKGDYVAQTGNTGKSTGPHLHFEIHLDGEQIDPALLLGDV